MHTSIYLSIYLSLSPSLSLYIYIYIHMYGDGPHPIWTSPISGGVLGHAGAEGEFSKSY